MSIVRSETTVETAKRAEVGKISKEFSNLNDSVCGLESMTNELEERLQHVLTLENVRGEKTESVNPEEPKSDMAMTIGEYASRVRNSLINIQRIINRLEL